VAPVRYEKSVGTYPPRSEDDGKGANVSLD
jgi:hypothetical protein